MMWLKLFFMPFYFYMYHYHPKVLDRQVMPFSADRDQTAPGQRLHCVLFHLHLLKAS